MGFVHRYRWLDKTVLIWFFGTYIFLHVTWTVFELLGLTAVVHDIGIGSPRSWASATVVVTILFLVLFRKWHAAKKCRHTEAA